MTTQQQQQIRTQQAAGNRIFAMVLSITQIPSLGKLKQWLPHSEGPAPKPDTF